jgi:hypothetical protein
MTLGRFSGFGVMVVGLLVSRCGGDDRPPVLGPYDPRAGLASDAGAPADNAPADNASADDVLAPPVLLGAPDAGARCGRWFCADELPRSGSTLAVGDIDGDGRPDLLLADTGRVLASLGGLTLLHNDGGMRFSDATARAHLAGYGAWSAIFGDLDNDGDTDLVMGGRRAGEPETEHGDVLIFYNDGHGRFAAPVSVPRWGAGVPLALDLVDMNVDGRLDILVSLSGTDPHETYSPRLLAAHEDGPFVVQETGLNDDGFSWVTLATDLDDDQYPDVLTAHDGHATYQITPGVPGTRECEASDPPGTASWLNAAYRNVGEVGDFRLAVRPTGPAWESPDNTPMSLIRGDFDADGRLDLLTTQGGNPTLFSVTRDGALVARPDWPGTWSRTSTDDFHRSGGVGWGAVARDLDRDGDTDAIVAYGVIPVTTTTWPNTVYLNERERGLALAPADTGLERPGQWSAMAAADFDGDGDADLVIGGQTLFRRPCDGPPSRALLLTNVSEWPGRHWLRVRLVGTVSNRDAIGARIEGVAGGLSMIREVSRGGSTMSSSTRVVDFGLGAASSLDVLRVRWPSGAVQTLRAVAGDQEITVREPRWLSTDMREARRQQPVTVRLSSVDMQSFGVAPGAIGLELRGRGRWMVPPATEPTTGDLVGRFTGDGDVWVRTVGPRAGPRAESRVRFH